MDFISRSESDTGGFAARLAPFLRQGDLLTLQGDLGAGKSVLARALIRARMRDEALDVPSPTFTLVQTYDDPVAPIWHFDLYRMEQPDEIYELGWEDARADAICIVEWPERLGALLPSRRIDVRIGIVDGVRHITLHQHGDWQERIYT